MIEIIYDLGQVNRIEISGHAGYDDTGKDIVCAGVSAVFYALCGYLENYDGDCRAKDESGNAFAECRGADEAFKMAVIGLLQIEQAYPENVRVMRNAELGIDNPSVT